MMISGSLPSLAPVFPLTSAGAAGPAPGVEVDGQPSSRVADTPRGSSAGEDAGSDRSAENATAEERSRSPRSGTENAQGLDEAELEQLAELKARDREVRAHEAAHQSVGGQYTGSISYVYERGPDGAQYAVGGEVSIDTSPIQGDPQATIDKMRVVRAAALAPAEPSPQDRAVAAEAMQLMLQAQADLSAELGRSSEPGQAGPAAGNPGSDSGENQSREAASAYQVISGIGAGNVTEEAAFPFRATA